MLLKLPNMEMSKKGNHRLYLIWSSDETFFNLLIYTRAEIWQEVPIWVGRPFLIGSIAMYGNIHKMTNFRFRGFDCFSVVS